MAKRIAKIQVQETPIPEEVPVEPVPPPIPAIPEPQVPPPPRTRREPTPMPVEMPRNEIEILNNVICREAVDPTIGEEVPPDPTLTTMNLLVNGITNGSDLTHVEGDVKRILSNPKEKVEIILRMIRQHDFYRMNHWIMVRADHEARVFRASKRGDISTTESLAFMRIADNQIKDFSKTAKEDSEAQQSDTVTIIERVNPANSKADDALSEAYKNTTPHGREIIRKRLYDLKKKLAENDPTGNLDIDGHGPA